MSSILVVESKNDKYFIERLIEELNLIDVSINSPICTIDSYECLEGLSEQKLINTLMEIKVRIEKDGIDNIGIMLDADNEGRHKRLELINSAIKHSFDANFELERENQYYFIETLETNIACHILNIDGHGELETMLKTIKSKPSLFADCLGAWQECLQENEKSLSQKEFDKFWVSIYQRYDTCSKKEQKQAGRKCHNYEASLKKDIWNFSHNTLDDLKAFLELFRV